MSVERKSLFIVLFVQSHLVLSSIAEEKLKHRCQAILQFDANQDISEIQNVGDYAHHLDYVKDWVIKALDKSEKPESEVDGSPFGALKTRIENAASGEELFWIIENMQG